jgi:hypothetical protein
MNFGTNPFRVYHAPGSKEHISLNKQATLDFKPKRRFDLVPSNAKAFTNDITACSEFFSYGGHLSSIPTDRTVEADGTITFDDRKNILTSWNEIDSETIQKYATEIWGDKSWTVTEDKQIVGLSVARGEVVANNLNLEGKKKFTQRKQSAWLAYQILAMLTDDAREQIEVDRDQYIWIDPISGETIKDGFAVLHPVLQHLCPNVRLNVFNELKKIKAIITKDYGYDMAKWLSAMSAARISITSKSQRLYPDEIFISDLLDDAEQVPCKAWLAKVARIKNR